MATKQTLTNPKSPLQTIQLRKLSWLDHAERHYKSGTSSYLSKLTEYIDPTDEALMYLCLFSYVGMFDCPANH
jgi:hypothetical protein